MRIDGVLLDWKQNEILQYDIAPSRRRILFISSFCAVIGASIEDEPSDHRNKQLIILVSLEWKPATMLVDCFSAYFLITYKKLSYIVR